MAEEVVMCLPPEKQYLSLSAPPIDTVEIVDVFSPRSNAFTASLIISHTLEMAGV